MGEEVEKALLVVQIRVLLEIHMTSLIVANHQECPIRVVGSFFPQPRGVPSRLVAPCKVKHSRLKCFCVAEKVGSWRDRRICAAAWEGSQGTHERSMIPAKSPRGGPDHGGSSPILSPRAAPHQGWLLKKVGR